MDAFRIQVATNLYLFSANMYRFGVLGSFLNGLTNSIVAIPALTPLKIMRYVDCSFLECLLTCIGDDVEYDPRS